MKSPLTEIEGFKDMSWKEAAVLVICYEKDGEEYLVLTRRTDKVLHHKGQICLPGGVFDPGDGSLWNTALRETMEEIGLDPNKVTFDRELGKQYTPTGYKVTPFVGTVKIPFDLKPSPHETDEVFSVPISHLRNPENFRLVRRNIKGFEFMDPTFFYDGREIWGMTARILCEFLKLSVGGLPEQ